MTTGAELPAPVPEVQPETAAFWEATSRGVLLVQRCTACGTSVWYPRFLCSNCHSSELKQVEASGRATVYSFTLTTRGILEYKDCGPYVLALVELEEGPKMLTNIVECDPETLSIGQSVQVVFHDTGAGSALPRFRPAA
ncbi:Zn-ribbon domain-containing OB-fold protein [Protofrankia coriariae]|uniref:Nucleotide-binding protein n=1 Tax=Protofrankia coriariae TaxID=1562887 RepID=A0ABR5EZD2_9ACTN|nr:OB-fold domain-containing protein [Protofrankia coriariae]KLL09792.1 nucleotide-binding protein [Protofrankia coriariae]